MRRAERAVFLLQDTAFQARQGEPRKQSTKEESDLNICCHHPQCKSARGAIGVDRWVHGVGMNLVAPTLPRKPMQFFPNVLGLEWEESRSTYPPRGPSLGRSFPHCVPVLTLQTFQSQPGPGSQKGQHLGFFTQVLQT